jgi:ATP-binding cassette, subfamily B, bacterial MsbA
MNANQLILKFTFKYPLLLTLTVILGFSGALFNGVSTALVVPLVLAFLGQGDLNLQGAPKIIEKLISVFNAISPDYRLLAMTGVVLFAIILKNLAFYFNYLCSSYLSRSLVTAIRLEGLKILLDVDIDFYEKSKLGTLVNYLGQEVNKTSAAIRTGISIFTNIITIFVFTIILILISWQLTLACTFMLLIVAFINQYFVKYAKYLGQIQSDKYRDYSTAIYEFLGGMRLIKTVSNEQAEYQKLIKIIKKFERADLKAQANYAAIAPINEVSGIVVVLTIIFVGKLFFAQQLEAISAVILTYLVVLFRLMPFVGQLNGSRSEFANGSPSAEIVANFLRRDNKPIMVNGNFNYDNFHQAIKFENVSFHYPEHESLILKNVNLSIAKGTTLALVGASGAGKSTLAELLARFYDPIEGKITIDGKDIKEYNLKSLRKAMGIVSQDTFLFNNSLRYNIAYGCEDATEESIIEAAKRANAYQFIMDLPAGFDTQIGDRGVLLSGGQRQRIAIARALLRNPDILILDEATSALDTVSERLVQSAIDELCKERTTLVIAHRLSTVQKADQIAVLDQGKVVEIGKHEELLNQGGYYSRLYNLQFSKKPQDIVEHEALINTSYQVRSLLTPTIGYLRLILDQMIENPQEQKELTDSAYESALEILKTLEEFEEQVKSL